MIEELEGGPDDGAAWPGFTKAKVPKTEIGEIGKLFVVLEELDDHYIVLIDDGDNE